MLYTFINLKSTKRLCINFILTYVISSSIIEPPFNCPVFINLKLNIINILAFINLRAVHLITFRSFIFIRFSFLISLSFSEWKRKMINRNFPLHN
jgi:hypothetical protein